MDETQLRDTGDPTAQASPAVPAPPGGGGAEDALRSFFDGDGATLSALLLVAGERAHAERWTAGAAVEVAEVAARHRAPVFLADLELEDPTLHLHLDVSDEEGITDVLFFGASVRRVARPVEGYPFALIPAGPPAPDPEEALASRGWAVALAEVARTGGIVLLYVPAGAPGLPALAARVGHALALAAPGEDVAALLPEGCRVDAVLSPPPAEAPEPEFVAAPAPEAVAAPEPVPEAVAEPEPLVDAVPEPEPEPEVAPEPEVGDEPASAWEDEESALEIPATARIVREEEPEEKSRPGEIPGRYVVPDLPAWQERLVRGVAVVTLLYGTYYIAWRWTSTLNTGALWFSIPLALAETWGLLTAFIMVHSVWRLRHRRALPPPPELSVDVFITAYDEPLEVIRRTAVGARAIRYPHRTYLLDDGKRDEVRAMAEELGIGYLRREGNEHAKAGNLNHALRHTGGEFILQLDADHVPLPHILDRLLGFFARDERLAFVQSPQDFYNTDGFTYDVSETWQRIWEEQRLFFSVIQPGKDSLNGAFFCGSCAVFRRAALESVGGFSTETITEDIETSLVLHAHGWRSAYYGESLAYGLAAGSATAFHVQHLRWGEGAMQVLRKFNPLTYPGLTLAQRVSYFGSLTAYVGGVQKLIFYAAPLVFFLTGALPLRAIDREFLVRFAPFLALSFLLSEMTARGTANTWISERYHMAKFWTYTRACTSFFVRRPQRFHVTPKGPGHVPFATYAPHVVLMATTVVAMVWASFAYRRGWIDYGVAGWESGAFLANFLWASLNFLLAAAVVQLSLRVRQHRSDHRFRDQFALHVRVEGNDEERGRSYLALSENLNPGGIGFRIGRELAPGTRLRLALPLATGTVHVDGEVVHSRAIPGESAGMYRTGVRFEEVPMNVRDAIELHCTHHAVPLEQAMYGAHRGILSRTAGWVRDVRGERRTRVNLPARVVVGGGEQGVRVGRKTAFLEEISEGGARLVMDEPVPPGTPVRYRVPGTRIRGRGRVAFSRATETPIGVRFAIGVQRTEDVRRQPDPERNMGVSNVLRRASALLCLPLVLGVASTRAHAQLQPVVYAATEFDTQDLALFVVGAAVNTTNPGPGLVAGATGIFMNIPTAAGGKVQVNGVQPYVGPRYSWTTGAVQATVGYQFLNGNEDATGFGSPTGGEEGVVTALQGNYWGNGTTSGQAIASYNWKAQYFWGQLRGLQQFATLGTNPARIGAEVIGQGGGSGVTGDYRAIQFGPVLELQLSPAFRLAGSAGAKSDNRPDSPNFFPYVRLDVVLVP